MATYHNCSKGYLFGRGLRPFILWLAVGIAGYLVFLALNDYVSTSAGLWGKVLWILATALLVYRWFEYENFRVGKQGNHYFGYRGEMRIREVLISALPDNWHVFFDVKISQWGGNIDFVLVSTAGVYAIEVKNWSHAVSVLNRSRFGRNAWAQTHAEGIKLHAALASLHPHWVRTVLILTNQDTYSPRNENKVHILGTKEIEQYFTQETRIHDQRLADEQVKTIVTRLEQLAGCKTHAKGAQDGIGDSHDCGEMGSGPI